MTVIRMSPERFWQTHIPSRLTAGWVEDSDDVSEDVKLSRREILNLVLLSYVAGTSRGEPWEVGYDPGHHNDGFIAPRDRESQVKIESKLVPGRDEFRDVLQGILGIYQKTTAKGEQYASGLTLALSANRAPNVRPTLVRISDLRDLIADSGGSQFDRVFLIGAASSTPDEHTIVFHINQCFPEPADGRPTEIVFSTATGQADVRLNTVDCF